MTENESNESNEPNDGLLDPRKQYRTNVNVSLIIAGALVFPGTVLSSKQLDSISDEMLGPHLEAGNILQVSEVEELNPVSKQLPAMDQTRENGVDYIDGSQSPREGTVEEDGMDQVAGTGKELTEDEQSDENDLIDDLFDASSDGSE